MYKIKRFSSLSKDKISTKNKIKSYLKKFEDPEIQKKLIYYNMIQSANTNNRKINEIHLRNSLSAVTGHI